MVGGEGTDGGKEVCASIVIEVYLYDITADVPATYFIEIIRTVGLEAAIVIEDKAVGWPIRAGAIVWNYVVYAPGAGQVRTCHPVVVFAGGE